VVANAVPPRAGAAGGEAEGKVDAVLEVTAATCRADHPSDRTVNFEQHLGLSVSDHLRGKDRRLTIREKFHK
jgi:hypothetical protein